MTIKLSSIKIGLSLSDFDTSKNHLSRQTLEQIDYVEYGGFNCLHNDPATNYIRNESVKTRINRHVVNYSLIDNSTDRSLVINSIMQEKQFTELSYLVTDFGYWNLGGDAEANIWFRPNYFCLENAAIIANNAKFIADYTNLPFYIENPYVLHYHGNIFIDAFLNELANLGCELCIDIGHLYALIKNYGYNMQVVLDNLPYDAFRMAHIAGLSKHQFENKQFFFDNHEVVPFEELYLMLDYILQRSKNIRYVTYEAESATNYVKNAGLKKLREVISSNDRN